MIFQKTEENFKRISNAVVKLTYAGYILYIIKPGVEIMLAYITDNITETTFLAPFHDSYISIPK